MKAITLDTTDDRFVISINKKLISKDALIQLIDNLRVEFLAQKIEFDESIMEIEDDIKSSWWEANKERFIPKKEQ